MAITLNGTPASTDSDTSATITIPSYVVAPGSNRVMYVWCEGNFFQMGLTPVSVTYAGIPLTQILNAGLQPTQAWYRLIAPPVGTANVVVTYASTARAIIGVSVFNGVDQATPNGSFTTNSVGANVTWSFNATVVPGKVVLEHIGKVGGSMNPPFWANGHGATELWDQQHRLGEFGFLPLFAASAFVTPGATPFNFIWTSTGSNSGKQHTFTQLNAAPPLAVAPSPVVAAFAVAASALTKVATTILAATVVARSIQSQEVKVT